MAVGVLCGTCLYGHKTTQRYRDTVVKRLNDGELDGIIMGQRVGGCGHNLVGANHILFMGSLYSLAYEQQATGSPLLGGAANFNRPNDQKRTNKAVPRISDRKPELCRRL